MRRARAWFPCVDTLQAMCPFQLQITVAADQVAVASGQLDKQTWSLNQTQKTFFYTMRFPTPACHITLAVGETLWLAKLQRGATDSYEHGLL